MAREVITLPVPQWLRRRWQLWAVRNCIDHLWTFDLVMVPKMPAGIAASTDWTKGYHNANIKFSMENYELLTTRETDLLINHEQYHLLAARETDAMVDMIGADTTVVYKAYLRELERVADAFSHIMVRAYQRKRS
jgi:hypothetical protein